LVLKDRYSVEAFTVSPAWAGPYHGLDFGYSADPSAGMRLYVDDSTTPRTLYVANEFWQLHCENDALAGALEAAIPGISRHVVFADSARPETISYLQKNGLPNIAAAAKWQGSVADGVAYLRTFRIVISPECKHFLDECMSYSFEVDRLTGVPQPKPIDRNNHLIDSTRYALGPLIAAQPAQGYFSRTALLVKGEPVVPADVLGRPQCVFATVAACDNSMAVGLIYWAYSPHYGYPFMLLDYEVAEIDEAVKAEWIAKVYTRAAELRREWNPVEGRTTVWSEQLPLYEALADQAQHLWNRSAAPQYQVFDVGIVESKTLLPTLDDRAAQVRGDINAGRYCKLARSAYTHDVLYRTVRSPHLTNQILGFRPGTKDKASELVQAFLLGFAFSANPMTEAPAATLTALSEQLAGAPVPAPPSGLPPGRHVVNGKIVIIPGPGLRIGL
jgi:hypothetical protein